MIPDAPENSVYQLACAVLLLVAGIVGAWLFDRLKPPPNAGPDLAAATLRRNKAYRDASLMVIGFGLFALLHFVQMARRAHGVQW